LSKRCYIHIQPAIASIALYQVGGHRSRAGAGRAYVSAGVSSDALGRPGPVLIDLPFDVQMAEIEFEVATYEPPAWCTSLVPLAPRSKALTRISKAERPLIVAGGGIINADRKARLSGDRFEYFQLVQRGILHLAILDHP
jgi:hypothetical protein